MDKKFTDEIKKYSYDDLKLIYDTQQDLYSSEEMKIIQERMDEMLKTGNLNGTQDFDKKALINQRKLPKKIICPKCDQPNPFENNRCAFCEYEFDKSKYFRDDYIYDPEDESNNADTDRSESHAFQYIFSFLIPIIGFILGAILLSKDDEDDRSVGKVCIILGVISVLIGTAVAFVAFR